jgi:flagellar basal-body rod protein FlgG
MDRGLYIAASGMLAEQVRQDQIANDLANASTPGYKADRTGQRTFGDILLANRVTGQVVGPQSLAVQVGQVQAKLAPEPAKDTGEPLDFAILGDGYFAVRTPAGVRYTRNGQFEASAQGTLVTPAGDAVLGRNGQSLTVGADGRVDPNLLGVTALRNAAKQGDNLFTGTPGGGQAGTVRAGALEESGVDAAESMVDMIASLRAFEAGQRAITTIDETLGKSVNQVGSVTG